MSIQRVVLIYRPENLERSVREFADVLGIDTFKGPFHLVEMGLIVAYSMEAGIEFIAPDGKGPYSAPMWEVLNTRGEGLFNFVFQVEHLNEAQKRAELHGHPGVSGVIDALEMLPALESQYSLFSELALPPIAGVSVTIAQVRSQ